jgi:hypothetical protein
MIKPYIEIIKYLLEKSRFVKTKDLQRYLESQGLLIKSYQSNRRLLQKYLENLEYEGYIERKYEKTKGRQSQEWKINPKSFPKIIGISEKEFISLIITTSFMPDDYKNLSFLSDIQNIINRTFFEITDEKREILENAFKYVPEFHEKFSKINPHLLSNIFKGIFEKVYLKLLYKDKWLKVAPVKIFLYQGILYISAVDEDNQHKILKFSCITNIVETQEKVQEFFIKKYRKLNFGFEDEKPFIFAVDIPKWYLSCESLQTTKLLNTQFFAEENKENIKVYLIGYTGWRFPSRMFVPHIEKIYKPDEEILNTAKKFKKQIKKIDHEISFSLKENLKRFNEFLDNFKYYLEQRNRLINILKEGQT